MKRKRIVLAALVLALVFLFAAVGCGGGKRQQRTCPTCGGTGTVYQPNLFYDGMMWQGGYVGCPGCGGSGRLP